MGLALGLGGHHIEDVWQVAAEYHDGDVGYALQEVSPAAAAIVAQVRGDATPWLAHRERWKAQASLQGRQLDQYLSDIDKFPGEMLEDLRGPKVQAWIEVQLATGISPKTVRRKLAALQNYWGWMQGHGHVGGDAHPFKGRRVPRAAVGGPKREAFTRAEVMSLHAAAGAKGDKVLADLITLGAHTGARIEEICNLKVAHVDLESRVLRIVASKTQAGIRAIPLHAAIVPLVTRLAKDTKDGYLILATAQGKYAERSAPISKRFGNLKTAQGFGATHVYHSIRKTVATLLEDSGCPEGIASDILSHEKMGQSFGLYSGGASMETKRIWLTQAVHYPR